jgi:hypothetical protein
VREEKGIALILIFIYQIMKLQITLYEVYNMVEIDHGFTTDMKYAIAGTFTGGLSSKGFRLLKKGTEDSWFCVNQVYPVCENKNEVEGVTAYSSLKDLPEHVDVVIVVHKKELTTYALLSLESWWNEPYPKTMLIKIIDCSQLWICFHIILVYIIPVRNILYIHIFSYIQKPSVS